MKFIFSANNVVRECNTDSDCLEIPYTSCAVDPNDRKKRCFCADGKQPLNGDCLKKPRGMSNRNFTLPTFNELYLIFIQVY